MTNKPIPRLSRNGAVWMTFWRRPLVWVFIVVLVLLSPAGSKSWSISDQGPVPDGQNNWSKAYRSAIPNSPQPNPHASISFRGTPPFRDEYGRPIVWSSLRSLIVFSDVALVEELWKPGELPHLESLIIYTPIQDHQLQKLCELYDLRSLTLISAPDVTDVGLDELCKEPRLEYLQIHITGPPRFDSAAIEKNPQIEPNLAEMKSRTLHHAKSLRWPQTLRTLIFDDVYGTVNPVRLQEWQQLPKLQTLYARLIPPSGSRLSDEMLTVLRNFPHLRTLYVHEYPAAAELAAVQQQLLPGIRVRPSSFDSTPGRRALIVIIASILVIALLAVQLSTHFVSSASWTTPNFAGPHITAFVVGIGFVWMASVVALLNAGCLIIGAIGAAAIGPLIFFSIATVIFRGSKLTTPGFVNFALAVIFGIFACSITWGLATAYGSEFAWFLQGHQSWLAIAFFVGATWLTIDLVNWHQLLLRRLEEAGYSGVPLSLFDTSGWNQWVQSVTAAQERAGKKNPLYAFSPDVELDRLNETAVAVPSARLCQLWRLGMISSATFAQRTIASFLLSYILISVALISVFGKPMYDIFWPNMVQVVFMLLFFPFILAAGRRQTLVFELLRPMERRDWIRSWFRGSAEMARPATVASVTFLFIAWGFGKIEVSTVILSMLALPGGIAILLGFGLWLITMTSLWKALFSVVVMATVLFCGVLMVAVTNDTIKGGPTITVFLVQLGWIALSWLIAAIALRAAWWRWQNFEVGLIAD